MENQEDPFQFIAANLWTRLQGMDEKTGTPIIRDVLKEVFEIGSRTQRNPHIDTIIKGLMRSI